MATGSSIAPNEKVRADSLTEFGQFGRRGVISGTAVSASSGMTVTASAGYVYFGKNVATVGATNLTASAADPTDDRFDLVVSDSSGALSIIEGTPDGNPVVPTFDIDTYNPIARLTITAGLTTITSNEIKDTRILNDVATGGWNPEPAFVGDAVEQLKIDASTASTTASFTTDVVAVIIKNGGANTTFINQGASAAVTDAALASGDSVVWSDSSKFNDIAAITASGTSAIYMIGVR